MNKNTDSKAQKSKSGSFFSKHKLPLIICAGVIVVAAVILTVVLAIKRNSDNGDNVDKSFDTEKSVLEDVMSFSDDELYAGYFEDDVVEVTVTCLSGSADCYTVVGNTVTFTSVSEDSVYTLSGRLRGNIVIDVGDGHKFELELHGFAMVCDTENPVTVLSGDKVSVIAKKEYDNYIYDMREAIDDSDTASHAGAVWADVDLELAGKGNLIVVSKNNNGIHTKKDLKVKNLNLRVSCIDNALKGNDSVTLEDCTTELIARQGDGIKTVSTDISGKGKQRGTVSISGGTHVIGAACDGIDAAYDVIIDGEETSLTVYTDKYSSASEEVTAVSNGTYYLRYTNRSYKFSVKYYNSDSDFEWVNVSDSYETVTTQGNRPGSSGSTYYYYSFAKKSGYSQLAVYMYSGSQAQGQDSDYAACSDYKNLNSSYDTLAVSYANSSLSLSWTNYATTSQQQGGPGGIGGMGKPGGMGGMNDGNTDKGEYSTKGIKAGNAVTVNNGTVNIKSYDDAIHADSSSVLENGSTALGNVTVNGGTLTLYSNDDGIHADGTVTVTGGKIVIENSYEGLEGANVLISGGNISVYALDDGINGVTESGTAVEISGGSVYIYCTGDGIDSNSRDKYSGIVFSGGTTVVIANSNGNSAIDTENGYKYSGGTVIAVMPSSGMTQEVTDCSDFSSIGSKQQMSLSKGASLTANVNGSDITVEMPCNISKALVVVLGDKNAKISS